MFRADPALAEYYEAHPVLKLINMETSDIAKKHQNDWKLLTTDHLSLDELRAVAATLPNYRYGVHGSLIVFFVIVVVIAVIIVIVFVVIFVIVSVVIVVFVVLVLLLLSLSCCYYYRYWCCYHCRY